MSTLSSTLVEAERRVSLLKIIKIRMKSHMTDASLLYICSIKQHKETLSEGGLMKFSIVLLVVVLGRDHAQIAIFF